MNNEKINSKIKLSNDSSFVILVFVFWNSEILVVLHSFVSNLDPHPVNCLENWQIFEIRNFLIWKFLGGIQIIEWSNVERPGFRNVKITNIKIMKNVISFFYLRFFLIF